MFNSKLIARRKDIGDYDAESNHKDERATIIFIRVNNKLMGYKQKRRQLDELLI